ncbi:MAG: hypothetical protein ACRBB6_04395 [Neptuniibacter sp.]
MKATPMAVATERMTVDQLEEHKSMLEDLRDNHSPSPKARQIYQKQITDVEEIIKRRTLYDIIGVIPHGTNTYGSDDLSGNPDSDS